MDENILGLKRSHYATDLSKAQIGQEVTVMGWVQKKRNLGSLIFFDLRDRSGIIQVYLDEDNLSKKEFEKGNLLRSEFVVAAKGILQMRGDGGVNSSLKTGKIEIAANEFRILSHAETTPFHIENEVNAKEDLRLKYRYLDLRRPVLQSNLILRHKLTMAIRKFLDQNGFLEIETPILTKSTPEGARDYLVPSRINYGKFYALPQSPQLYKQLLMLAGMDKYFQIAKCFRDEDLRADRQPEFTQIDMEMSFVDLEDIYDINERLMQYVFKEILNYDIKLPIKRITYKEAMERFGSDKPDMRFGLELTNVSEIVSECGFGVFESAIKNGGSVRAINGKGMGSLPRKQIDRLTEVCKAHNAKGMAYVIINEDASYKSTFSKFVDEDLLDRLANKLGGEPGDLLCFVADQDDVVFSALSALRLDLAERMDLIDKDVFDFVWVTDFPLFEYSKDQGRYVSKHHPFTMPREEDIEKMKTKPEEVLSKAYDLCLNGYELGGGSLRIYQNDIQRKMFDALGFTEEDYEKRFGFLLNAFKYGVPPHGGIAFGLDRLAMLMTGASAIRDVIAFPKVKDASDLMMNAPDVVDEKQLNELNISIKKRD